MLREWLLNRGVWSRQGQHGPGAEVVSREIARMPADAVTRVGDDWPMERSGDRWWDRRRGDRTWSLTTHIAIKRRMAEIAPDVYVYFDSPHDAPDAYFDVRWEAVANALEDAVYAEVHRDRISSADYARLRARWDTACG